MTPLERLTEAARRPPPTGLLTGDRAEDLPNGRTPAAVLVGITDRTDPGLLLTLRRSDLRNHPGQIAFPGGRVDAGEDTIAAALREAWEEVGLRPTAVAVAGALDSYVTVTGYEVTPVLAQIPADLNLVPHEAEVADIFEADLRHLLDPANHLRRTALFEGRERHYYEIFWQGRRIWGATAAMIVNLSKRLQWQ